jgi:hypothetical protein
MGANIKSVHTESLKAAADLSAYQYHGVKMSANRTVNVISAITDVPVGVLQNDPNAANKGAEVLVQGRTVIVAGETIAAGNLIRFDANGHAAIWAPGTDTTAYVAGQCIKGGDSGEYIEAIINCANPARGDC